MYILSVDTSSNHIYMCLYDVLNNKFHNKKVFSENSHSENLIGILKDITHQSNINLKELSLILIGRGPGSFTGLRIGYAFAKGIAFSLKIPIFEIDSLEAFSYEFRSKFKIIFSMLKAGRGEVFVTCINSLLSKKFENVKNCILNLNSLDANIQDFIAIEDQQIPEDEIIVGSKKVSESRTFLNGKYLAMVSRIQTC